MLILGNILVGVMAMLFVATCLFMMLVILIQKPKGGGLSGAFGGAGGSAQAAFGAKTGDLLTTITIACFVLFLGLAVGLVYAIRAEVSPRTATASTPPASAPADTTASDTADGNMIDEPGNGAGEQTLPPAEAATDAPAETDTPAGADAPTETGAGEATAEAPTETPAPDAQP